MHGSFVHYERHGSVAVVRLNRPERLNAVGPSLLSDLDATWRAVMADDEVRVAVYTGTGRAFCAGQDIKELASPDASGPPKSLFHSGGVSKPVVAAVNGLAAGSGVFDVLRCDVRLAAESASFRLPELSIGVLPNPILRGLTGGLPDAVLAALVLGFPLDARRAADVGLINHVVPDEKLMTEALDVAGRVAALPAEAVRIALAGLRPLLGHASASIATQEWLSKAHAELRRGRPSPSGVAPEQ
jgi:enoyl-CoA hydratase/carnithine racemase